MYAVFLTLIVPTARLLPGFQASVVVIAALFLMTVRAALQGHPAVAVDPLASDAAAGMRRQV
jgi:hypothetical protein